MRRNYALLLIFCFTASFLVAITPINAAETNSWESKAPMHEARAYLGVAVVNGKIYAIGGDTNSIIANVCPGTTRSNHLVGTNEEYDPAANEWTIKTSMPTARALFGMTAYQNEIYCIGGYDINYADLGINEVYDTSSDSWCTKTAMPSPAYGVIANVVDEKIYVIGGATTIGGVGSNVNYVYDPTQDSWYSRALPPYDITSLGSVVMGDEIYFVGALTNNSGLWNGTFVLEAYNTITDSWSIVAPSPRAYESGNGGGITSGVYAPKQIYFFDDNATYIFDLANNSWAVGERMLTARTCVGVAVVNDIFYVIGGRSGIWGYITIMNATDVTEQYLPFGYNPDMAPPEIRVISPQNTAYDGEISLNFTVDKVFSWIGYSVDAQHNVTVTGNITLSGLSAGSHSLIIYANDTAGHMGKSDTIFFVLNTQPSASPSTSQTPPLSPLPLIPEFPQWIVFPVLLIVLALVAYTLRRKVI
jgi:N-acetylneuraminic acid mutarotase